MIVKKYVLYILILVFSIIFIGWCSADHGDGRDADAQRGNTDNKTEIVKDKNETNENLLKKYKMDNSFILIVKSKFEVYAIDDMGKVVAVYPCALGKNSGQKEKEGDMKTPSGIFPIDEIIDASSWTHDFKDGKGEITGAYGPWFISLDTNELSKGKWGGIGIHGTHDPDSIGKKVSEGCIRLKNDDVQKLKAFAKVGMKVVIEE